MSLKRRATGQAFPSSTSTITSASGAPTFSNRCSTAFTTRCAGRVVQLLVPGKEDYFVLKPKHSAFYATPLELLLTYLKVSTLILTGIAGDVCVLFTAGDAFLRDYHLFVPSDCIASQSPRTMHAVWNRCVRRLTQIFVPRTNWI